MEKDRQDLEVEKSLFDFCCHDKKVLREKNINNFFLDRFNEKRWRLISWHERVKCVKNEMQDIEILIRTLNYCTETLENKINDLLISVNNFICDDLHLANDATCVIITATIEPSKKKV